MFYKTPVILISILSFLLTACATLELTEGGNKIRMLTPDEISSCKEIGKTNTTITDRVLGIDRPIEALERELQIIARNSAHNMGGDTIVPLTVVKEGRQTFVVYKCVDPEG